MRACRLIQTCCALALLLWTVPPAHAQNTPWFDESFEYANDTAWLSSGNWASSSCTPAQHAAQMTISSERAFSGTKSLKFTYVGDLGATAVACFLERYYPTLVETAYSRVYLYLDGFTASNINTKLYTHSHDGHYPRFWWSLHLSNNTHRVAVEASPTTNIASGNFPSGRWVCMETRVTLNTPGQANGIIQSWIDGAPRINSTNLVLRNATEVLINGSNYNGPSAKMQYTRIYRQHGVGVIYWDRFAHGPARIGCLDGQTDTTAPGPVSNFRVN